MTTFWTNMALVLNVNITRLKELEMDTLWQRISVYFSEASQDTEYRWYLAIAIIAVMTITTLFFELIKLRWWVKRHAKTHSKDVADLNERLAAIEGDLKVEVLLEQVARAHAANVAHAEPSDHLSQQLGLEVIHRFVEWLKVNASDVLSARFQQMAKDNADEAVAGQIPLIKRALAERAEELALNMTLIIGQGKYDPEILNCMAVLAEANVRELCREMEETVKVALKEAILKRLPENTDQIVTDDVIRDGISELLAAGIEKLVSNPSGELSEKVRQMISESICEITEKWIGQQDADLEKAAERIFTSLLPDSPSDLTEGAVDGLKWKINKAMLDVITTWADDDIEGDITERAEKIFTELLHEQLPEDIQARIKAMMHKGLLDQIDDMVKDGELAEPAAKLVKQQAENLFPR